MALVVFAGFPGGKLVSVPLLVELMWEGTGGPAWCTELKPHGRDITSLRRCWLRLRGGLPGLYRLLRIRLPTARPFCGT